MLILDRNRARKWRKVNRWKFLLLTNTHTCMVDLVMEIYVEICTGMERGGGGEGRNRNMTTLLSRTDGSCTRRRNRKGGSCLEDNNRAKKDRNDEHRETKRQPCDVNKRRLHVAARIRGIVEEFVRGGHTSSRRVVGRRGERGVLGRVRAECRRDLMCSLL